MIKKYITLGEVCEKGSSTIMQKDLSLGNGPYQIYGASGLLGTVDFYKQEKEYIGIVKDGAGVGRAMLLPEKSSCIGTMQYLIPRENINVRFLFYAIESMNLAKYNTGATIPHIYFKDYKKEVLPLFDIQEQQEIAHQFDKIKSLISYRQSQLKYFDDLVKSQFIEMFGGYSLRDKQPHWVKIGSVAEVVGGSTPKTEKREFWGGNHCWITPAEIDDDSFIVKNTVRRLTDEGVKSCSLKRLPIGTVLLSSRAPIGKVAIAGVEMYCNQGFKNLICGQSLNSIYIYYLLKFNSEYLNSLGRGATFKEISKAIVNNIAIPVPEMKRQNQFAAFVEQTDKSKIPFEMEVAA